MLSFYFFIGCLSLSGRLRALGINHPKEKSKKPNSRGFLRQYREKILFPSVCGSRRGLSGSWFRWKDFIGGQIWYLKYRHMGEIVYDNVVPFDRTQWLVVLGVMTQGRVRDNFKWFLKRVEGKIILEKPFKR